LYKALKWPLSLVLPPSLFDVPKLILVSSLLF
jgi:hypothetical protein